MDKKVKALNVGVVLVDYINQVKKSAIPNRAGQYDWTEQIEVSKALKSMAQEYDCTVISPYQTDASGEARFAKGILDAADAAYALETYEQEDACITFNCVKMRNSAQRSFTSSYELGNSKDWTRKFLVSTRKRGLLYEDRRRYRRRCLKIVLDMCW